MSEPLFCGHLVYKFKEILGKPIFSDQFRGIVRRYKNKLAITYHL